MVLGSIWESATLLCMDYNSFMLFFHASLSLTIDDFIGAITIHINFSWEFFKGAWENSYIEFLGRN